MALYAIGDLHLCLGAPKPMDVFGGAWVGYMEKLKQGLSVIRPEDTTVLCGDLSWALGLEAAKEDFAWIDQIPGRKIILKGNHDYWWSTASKFHKFCQDNQFSDQFILNNNFYEYEDWAICGTRGWFFEEERSGQHECREIIDLLHQYQVRRCYYGHLHADSRKLAMEGVWDGVEYRLVSADHVNFCPVTVIL